ncbi:MAG: hypothetical protein ACTSQZ_02995, partial [Candidatus Thorarchaeota archaeon]
MFLGSRLISRSPQLITTFLIFSLSAGVLGGIIFYTDSAAPSVLVDLREDVAFDMEISLSSLFYRQNTTTMNDITEVVSEEELIQPIEILNVISSEYYDYEIHRDIVDTYLGVDSTFFDSFPKAIQLSSVVSELNDSSCYLAKDTLEQSGLSIGDDYTALLTYNDDHYNEVQINSTYTIVGTFESNLFLETVYFYEPGRIETSTLRMITTEQGLITAFEEIGYGDWNTIQQR